TYLDSPGSTSHAFADHGIADPAYAESSAATRSRHHGRGPSMRSGSNGLPSLGVMMRASYFGASDSSCSPGSSHAWKPSENVPQWTGNSVPPPSMRNASSAFSGPRWIVPHAGWNAPISSMTRSNGPNAWPIAVNSSVRPVSPEKNSLRWSDAITHDAHSVLLR